MLIPFFTQSAAQVGDRFIALDDAVLAGQTNSQVVTLMAGRPSRAVLAVRPDGLEEDPQGLTAADVGSFAEMLLAGE